MISQSEIVLFMFLILGGQINFFFKFSWKVYELVLETNKFIAGWSFFLEQIIVFRLVMKNDSLLILTIQSALLSI